MTHSKKERKIKSLGTFLDLNVMEARWFKGKRKENNIYLTYFLQQSYDLVINITNL